MKPSGIVGSTGIVEIGNKLVLIIGGVMTREINGSGAKPALIGENVMQHTGIEMNGSIKTAPLMADRLLWL